MQQWSLEELTPSTLDDPAPDALLDDPVLCSPDFVEEFVQVGPVSLFNRLSQEERDQIFALVEGRIREKVTEELSNQSQVRDALNQQIMNELVKGLGQRIEGQVEEIARSAVELAIAMSERILRTSVELDRDGLARRIAEIAARSRPGLELSVLARPDDIDYLKKNQETLERLNVNRLLPDPNLSPGSCRVRSEGREWDLTLESQGAILADMVREAMGLPLQNTFSSPEYAETEEETDEPALV